MEDHHTEVEESHQKMVKLLLEEHNNDRQQKEKHIVDLKEEVSQLMASSEDARKYNDELTKEIYVLQSTNVEKTRRIEELDTSLEVATRRHEEMKEKMMEFNEVDFQAHMCEFRCLHCC